jgi:hypothetical protein
MLTLTDLPFKSEELAILRRTFAAYRTSSRSYMTAASMMVHLNHVVAPYVMFLRVARQDPAMVFLVMDTTALITPPMAFRR